MPRGARGSGYPSFFNADEVTMAQVGMGKRIEDAREGGTSGCIETGCFGKEAYLLHGYSTRPRYSSSRSTTASIRSAAR